MGRVSVKLRQREVKDGRKSLYLDIYHNGERKTEALGLYLIPEKGREEKRKNKATMAEAELRKGIKLQEIQEDGGRIREEKITIIQHFERHGESKQMEWGLSRYYQWQNFLSYLRKYVGKKEPPQLSKVTAEFIEGFKLFLLQMPSRKGGTLSHRTVALFYNGFLGELRKVGNEGRMPKVNFRYIKNMPIRETQRQYLTVEELKRLEKTPCDHPVRKIFLFSYLTGLRSSDVKKLRWEDLYLEGGRIRCAIRQQKTGGVEYLYFSKQVEKIIGDFKGKKGLIFEGKGLHQQILNKKLAIWVEAAGINKKITMHCARHTFVAHLLRNGTDFYTVSKLLGHRNIQTTLVYAKFMDEKRREAIDSLPEIL